MKRLLLFLLLATLAWAEPPEATGPKFMLIHGRMAFILHPQIVNPGHGGGSTTLPQLNTLTGCTFDGSGNVTCNAFTASGSGPSTFTAIADPGVPVAGNFWFSSTTAGTFKYADNNAVIQSFMLNPMTAAGDLTVGGASGAPTRVAAGSADNVLQGNGAASPVFKALPTTGTNGCAGATDMMQYNTTTHAWACGTAAATTGIARPNSKRWELSLSNGAGNQTSIGVSMSNITTGPGGNIVPTTTTPSMYSMTGTAAGNTQAGLIDSSASNVFGKSLLFQLGFQPISTTAVRHVFGVTSTTGANMEGSDATANGDYVACRYSTVADANGHYFCIERDGTTIATACDTGIVATDGAFHLWSFQETNATNWVISVDGVAKCTLSTNNPRAGQTAKMFWGCADISGSGSKQCNASHGYLEGTIP